MRGLAEHGAGNFYFLEDATAATEVFTEELDYFMSPLALDVQISRDRRRRLHVRRGTSAATCGATTSDGGSMSIPAVFVASRTSQSGGTAGAAAAA